MDVPRFDIYGEFSRALLGATCSKFEHPNDWSWGLTFSGTIEVFFDIQCLWRILANGTIVLTDEDHGQQFGLPQPVNAAERGLEILRDARVVSATIRAGTSDIRIEFDNGAQLEVFTNSCGYESWACVFAERHVIALGGGELAIMQR